MPRIAKSKLTEDLALVLYLGFVYGLLAKLASYLYVAKADVAYFWPANSVLIAIIFSTRPKRFAHLSLAIIPVEILVDHLNDMPLHVAFQIGCINSLEASITGFLLRRAISGTYISNLSELFRYCMATLLVPSLTGILGAATLVTSNMDSSFLHAWKLWWIGDGVGSLIYTLAFITLHGWFCKSLPAIEYKRRVEFFVLIFLTPIVAFFAFSKVGKFPAIHAIIFPMLVWAAMRFDLRGGALVMGEVAIVAALSNMYSSDQLSAALEGESQALATQIFLVVALSATFLLAVAFIERDRAEKELEQQREKSIVSSKMIALGEMAGGIAHEINNPLAIIGGKVNRLTMKLKNSELSNNQILEALQPIEKTVERIAAIVRGLLAFAGSRDHSESVNVTLQEIVDDALTLCLEKFKQSGVKVDISLTGDAEISCRPYQIVQVLLNLLHNSFDAVAGDPNAWIRVESCLNGDELTISVIDSGSGITQAVQDRMMEPFYSTKEVGKGTGLGLSISSGIAKSHGGRLEYDVRSENTRFNLHLKYQRHTSEIRNLGFQKTN